MRSIGATSTVDHFVNALTNRASKAGVELVNDLAPATPLTPWNIMQKAFLPDNADPGFIELIEVYQVTDIEFPHLKAMSLAQWALESGWGLSDLAQQCDNYAGMKWGTAMKDYGKPRPYVDWQGKEDPYVKFFNKGAFIEGYWARYDLISAYDGWRDHVDTADKWIEFVGPIWVGMSPLHNKKYVNNVKRIYRTRTKFVLNNKED